MPPEATTRVFALLGDPVAHSLSPRIQNAALAAAGLDGVYVALSCLPEDVPFLMRGLARAGGGGNITIPHKATALRGLAARSAACERTHACNTFWQEGARVVGDNTDVYGFDSALRGLVGDFRNGDVLLVGAGGGAAAALVALLDGDVGRVTIVNRTPRNAQFLASRVASLDKRVRIVSGLPAIASESFDIAVNATPLGLRDADPLPAPIDGAPGYRAAFDMVYSPLGTAWVHAAEAAGIRAIDGKEMLVCQAAAAFERWWQRPAPLDAMRAALA